MSGNTAMDTAPRLAQAAPALRDRAIALAAKLLAAHNSSQDRKPATAEAFGRALAVTTPGSRHGQLLAAALCPAKWDDRTRDQRLVLQLARSGETPTAGALAGRLEQIEAHRARGERIRARALPFLNGDGPRARAHVDAVVRATGAGPTWWELGDAMDWPPDHVLRPYVIKGLAMAGWLRTGTKPRSLRPGAGATTR